MIFAKLFLAIAIAVPVTLAVALAGGGLLTCLATYVAASIITLAALVVRDL